jgi:hypothetical protein
MPDLNPIEAHERAGGRIFSDEYAFEIPVYQRPYAWELEQVEELLTDLEEAMDGDSVYFLALPWHFLPRCAQSLSAMRTSARRLGRSEEPGDESAADFRKGRSRRRRTERQVFSPEPLRL